MKEFIQKHSKWLIPTVTFVIGITIGFFVARKKR